MRTITVLGPWVGFIRSRGNLYQQCGASAPELRFLYNDAGNGRCASGSLRRPPRYTVWRRVGSCNDLCLEQGTRTWIAASALLGHPSNKCICVYTRSMFSQAFVSHRRSLHYRSVREKRWASRSQAFRLTMATFSAKAAHLFSKRFRASALRVNCRIRSMPGVHGLCAAIDEQAIHTHSLWLVHLFVS